MAKSVTVSATEEQSLTPLFVSHKVRFVSQDKRYQRMPYPFTVAVSQSTGKFVTGQEHLLSEAQMRGLDKIPPSVKKALQMGDNPFIIHPDYVYNLQALRTFDLSYRVTGDGENDREYVNAKDFAEYTFFLKQEKVAPSKEDYQKNYHFFYLEDREKEALEEMKKSDRQFEAESFVRQNLPISRWKEVVMLLNYTLPKYMMDPNMMTETTIRETVIKACRENPDTVLMLKRKDSVQLVFVLKLLHHKLIDRKNATDFYAGETFIGTTIESVKLFTLNPVNEQLVTKWGKIIEERER